MLISDTTCLTYKQTIIHSEDVVLFYYTHDDGSVVLAANLAEPPGKVFFKSDDEHIHLFTTDQITLQELFDCTAEMLVTVVEMGEIKLYMRSSVEMQLCEGDKVYSQINRKN